MTELGREEVASSDENEQKSKSCEPTELTACSQSKWMIELKPADL